MRFDSKLAPKRVQIENFQMWLNYWRIYVVQNPKKNTDQNINVDKNDTNSWNCQFQYYHDQNKKIIKMRITIQSTCTKST